MRDDLLAQIDAVVPSAAASKALVGVRFVDVPCGVGAASAFFAFFAAAAAFAAAPGCGPLLPMNEE